ncbi:MAG: trypsin-like peptidase domain-containing protein, partial [Phycisphaerales bacterium]|nr:trypsin-like peptidase domain-containing protein [Phycisphaerales bacterium]
IMIGLVCLLSLGATAQPSNNEVRESVVKIFATYRGPDFSRPWTKQPPQELSGTGFVISENRILTNAHVVEQSTRIYVQPPNSADKLRAEVIGISQQMDLALIEIKKDDEREEFHSAHPVLELSDSLPVIGSTVQAIGYPMGGEQVSITEGVVSRIEFTDYNMEAQGLRIQVDAALNHGNSGGPVILDGKVCGVVFSGVEYAENIGYVIPAEEVNLFLNDLEDGEYDGPPKLYGARFQTCENDALRDFLRLNRAQTGIVYTRPDKDSDQPLQEWDVLDRIGEYDIDNAGMVTSKEDLRLHWRYYIREHAEDGKIPVTVLRNGEAMEMHLNVSNSRDELVPFIGNDYPEYFICGPMIFTPVRREHFFNLYLGYGIVDGSPVALKISDVRETPGQEYIVLAATFLPHSITKGYEVYGNPTLKAVNGIEINSVEHLVEVLRDNEEEMLKFEFFDRSQETLIFNAEELLESTEEVLEDNSIRRQGSDRFMKIWED